MSSQVVSLISISDLIDRNQASIQTGPFGTQLKASEYVESGIPVINVRNIGIGTVREAQLEYINEAKADSLSAHALETGDIVFGRKGAVDRHALITTAQAGWVQGSDCIRLRFDCPTLSTRFVSHYFRTQSHRRWMEAQGSFGATMASLNQGIIKRIAIPDIPYLEQRKIAAILTAYDDLIENNRQRIALLKKMAEEIYREWFVRLRFPGHERTHVRKGVPEGWKVKRLSDLVTLNYGKAMKADERSGLGFPVVGSSGVVGRHSEALVKGPGIVVGRKGNVGSVIWLDTDFYPIDTTYYIETKVSLPWIYYLLQQMNFLNADAAVPGLNRKQAYSNIVFTPPTGLVEKFADLVAPMFAQVRNLSASSGKLGETRDLLLNRLISGKLRVDDLDIEFPPSMHAEAA